MNSEQIEAIRAREDPRTEDLSQEGDAMVDALCDSHLQALRERRQLAKAVVCVRWQLMTTPEMWKDVVALAERILGEEPDQPPPQEPAPAAGEPQCPHCGYFLEPCPRCAELEGALEKIHAWGEGDQSWRKRVEAMRAIARAALAKEPT